MRGGDAAIPVGHIRQDASVTSTDRESIVRELFDRTLAAQRSWVAGDASGYIDLFSSERAR